MLRRALPIAFVTVFLGLAASPAHASYLVDRNAKNSKLQVDAGGHALVSYVAGGAQKHVLIWGALNALPPTHGKAQVAFKIDYSGGWKTLHKPSYFKTIKNACGGYKGPKLPWLVTACTASDGSSWALQAWQRMLPNLGFKPWRPDQSVVELRISHWKGPMAQIDVFQNWAWGNQYRQIVGQYLYGGKPVFGFGSTSVGAPTEAYGRNMYSTPSAPPTTRAGGPARTRSWRRLRTADSATHSGRVPLTAATRSRARARATGRCTGSPRKGPASRPT